MPGQKPDLFCVRPMCLYELERTGHPLICHLKCRVWDPRALRHLEKRSPRTIQFRSVTKRYAKDFASRNAGMSRSGKICGWYAGSRGPTTPSSTWPKGRDDTSPTAPSAGKLAVIHEAWSQLTKGTLQKQTIADWQYLGRRRGRGGRGGEGRRGVTEGGLGMVVVGVGWDVGGSSCSSRVEQSEKRWREVWCVCVWGGGGGKDYLS